MSEESKGYFFLIPEIYGALPNSKTRAGWISPIGETNALYRYWRLNIFYPTKLTSDQDLNKIIVTEQEAREVAPDIAT